MLNKIYVEITNICNLRCSFCHGTKRAPRQMSAGELADILEKIKGHTEYVYLHVLGEPLTHPELPQLLRLIKNAGLNACITTNGFLLKEALPYLSGGSRLYKLSVSLHSFEGNGLDCGLSAYLSDVWDAVKALSEQGTICALRLWNEGGDNARNEEIIAFLKDKSGVSEFTCTRSGYKVADRLYLESAQKFDWPDLSEKESGTQFCMGLRDQLAILCDGTVVPCCLDADGVLALGNIHADTLEEILASPRARAIYNGFSCRAPAEELCRRCGYAVRFNK